MAIVEEGVIIEPGVVIRGEGDVEFAVFVEVRGGVVEVDVGIVVVDIVIVDVGAVS